MSSLYASRWQNATTELHHYIMMKSYERWRRQYEPGRERLNPEDA